MKKLFLLLITFSVGAFAQNELPPQTLFTNVHVWDGTSDGITQRINVLVENNLIKKIRADASDAHSEATVIDAPGKILMPGLISSHVHLTHTLVDGGIPGLNAMIWEDLGAVATASAKEYLMMGFTTVRDMGGWSGVHPRQRTPARDSLPPSNP